MRLGVRRFDIEHHPELLKNLILADIQLSLFRIYASPRAWSWYKNLFVCQNRQSLKGYGFAVNQKRVSILLFVLNFRWVYTNPKVIWFSFLSNKQYKYKTNQRVVFSIYFSINVNIFRREFRTISFVSRVRSVFWLSIRQSHPHINVFTLHSPNICRSNCLFPQSDAYVIINSPERTVLLCEITKIYRKPKTVPIGSTVFNGKFSFSLSFGHKKVFPCEKRYAHS